MFDDYFPCQKDNCTLEHVRNWFNLFVDVHNSMLYLLSEQSRN
jgi:hypothetical protein